MRSTSYRVVSRWMVVLALVGGCDRSEEAAAGASSKAAAEPSAESLPGTLEYEVDAEGVFYLSLDEMGRRHPANDSSEIPMAERAAVGVHVSGAMPDSLGKSYIYVTTLFGAEEGERREAVLMAYAEFKRRARAGSLGGRRAAGVLRRSGALGGGGGLVRQEAEDPPEKTDSPETERERSGEPNSDENTVVIESAGDLAAYEDYKPARIEVEQVGSSGEPGEEAEDTREEKDGFRPTVVYGTEWCTYCQRAKEWMSAHGVPYEWRNIETSARAKKEMLRFTRRVGGKEGSVPTIRVQFDGKPDKIMQGWSASAFRRLARR